MPPTTQILPSTTCAEAPPRAVGMGARAVHVPVAGSKTAALETAPENGPVEPPKTHSLPAWATTAGFSTATPGRFGPADQFPVAALNTHIVETWPLLTLPATTYRRPSR